MEHETGNIYCVIICKLFLFNLYIEMWECSSPWDGTHILVCNAPAWLSLPCLHPLFACIPVKCLPFIITKLFNLFLFICPIFIYLWNTGLETEFSKTVLQFWSAPSPSTPTQKTTPKSCPKSTPKMHCRSK